MHKLLNCGCTAQGGPAPRIAAAPQRKVPIASAQSAIVDANVYKPVALRKNITKAEKSDLLIVFAGGLTSDTLLYDIDEDNITVWKSENSGYKLCHGGLSVIVKRHSAGEDLIEPLIEK